MIACADHVETTRAVRDHTGEDIETSGRALRIGRRQNRRRQREALKQRHNINAVGFEYRAVGQIDLVQFQFVDALGDRGVRAGQKAGPHPVSHLAQTQVEARRLDLALHERKCGQNQAIFFHGRDHAIGQNTVGVGWEREGQIRSPQD